MKTQRAPTLSVTPTSDSFVAYFPPRDEVQSRHRLQIDVVASDEDEACQKAQDIADRLLVSLSLAVPGGRYHAELRKIRKAGETRETTAWSQSVGATILNEPELLEEEDIEKVQALLEATEQDRTAETAYIHLLTAWKLQATAGSKPLERSVLQHYVLCLEAVVAGAMAQVKTRSRDKIRLEERKFAEEFAASLPKRADKPEAIREASTKLREISLINMLPSIERVAEMFQLPDSIRDQAKALYRFRSKSLSHPGRPKKQDLEEWLRQGPDIAQHCLADVVARAFFLGYCEYFFRGRAAVERR